LRLLADVDPALVVLMHRPCSFQVLELPLLLALGERPPHPAAAHPSIRVEDELLVPDVGPLSVRNLARLAVALGRAPDFGALLLRCREVTFLA
jgi:hypothetical protein